MCKVIVDACANHCGDRRLMDDMINAAARVGADFIKFQSWRANKLRKDWPDYDNALAYYKKHELSKDDHHYIISKCKENKIGFLTTVFDVETVNFLAGLGLKHIKIASPDCNSWRLIDKCLSVFDHVIISTGMHSMKEIEKLHNFVKDSLDKVTIMHCISLYPTPTDKVNMLRLYPLMNMFNSVGFSDHTDGTDAAKLAICLGASCVEKHFTLDRTLPGKDQAMSATIDEIEEMVIWRDKVQTMMNIVDSFPDSGSRGYKGRWGDNA